MRMVQRHRARAGQPHHGGLNPELLRLGTRFGISSSREWKLVKAVCFSKRITEILSSLYLFISKEGRTPLSPEPRSVARAQPSPAPASGAPHSPGPAPRAGLGSVPAPAAPGTSASQPEGLRDEPQLTPRAGTRVTRGAGGRSAPQPRATPDRPRSRGCAPTASAAMAAPAALRCRGEQREEAGGRFPLSSGSVPGLLPRAAPGRRVPGSPQHPARLRTHLPPGPSAAPPPR